jgi:hypothetical protein
VRANCALDHSTTLIRFIVLKDPPPYPSHKGRGVVTTILIEVVFIIIKAPNTLKRKYYLLPSLYGRGEGVGLIKLSLTFSAFSSSVPVSVG